MPYSLPSLAAGAPPPPSPPREPVAPATHLDRLRLICAARFPHAATLAKMPPTTLGRVAGSDEGARQWLVQRDTTTANRED